MGVDSPHQVRLLEWISARRPSVEISCRQSQQAKLWPLIFPGRWLLALVFFLILPGTCRGQEAMAILAGPTEAVLAGSDVSVWVQFLNLSNGPVTRAFPAKIVCRITAGEQVFNTALEARDPSESGKVTIPAGGFVRKEYKLILPQDIEGQALLEVPQIGANRVVLDVRKQQEAVPDEAEEPPKSFFDRFFREGIVPKKDYDPAIFFKQHFFGYEPIYFIAGSGRPSTKFQFSLRYQILNREGFLAKKVPPLTGLNFAYTQTSLWDLGSESSPFLDTSYKPELFYLWERVDRKRWADWFRLDLQGGFQHESNGNPEITSDFLGEGERTSYYVEDGSGGERLKTSRSLNILYLRPTAVFGKEDRLQFTLSPRVWAYVGNLSDNPDLSDYRGYADLRAIVGWPRGLQLLATGRLGDEGNRGSLQLDLTYPMMRLLSGSFSLYLHVQYFTGYGESLLLYYRRSDAVRFGISIYR